MVVIRSGQIGLNVRILVTAGPEIESELAQILLHNSEGRIAGTLERQKSCWNATRNHVWVSHLREIY